MKRSAFSLVALTLAACGASVAPLDASMGQPDAVAPTDSARVDAAPDGAVDSRIESIYALETSTYAIDGSGRAYGWGFIHFEGGGEYREPHRVPQLDGATAIRSIESMFTCAIFNRELRCSALNQRWRRIAWATDVVDYGITTSPIQLWVVSGDGRVRYSAGRELQALVSLPDAASDGEVALYSPVTDIDCMRQLCCATGADWRVQCWGTQSPLPRTPITPRSVSFVGYGPRVIFSHRSETYCFENGQHTVSCWGSGVHDAYSLPRSEPPQLPERLCPAEGERTAPCLLPPGVDVAAGLYDPAVTDSSLALVLNWIGHWSIEGDSPPWATTLEPRREQVGRQPSLSATMLYGLRAFERLSVGGSHACWTSLERRQLFCAGSNFAGQIGVDRRSGHDDRTPVEVRLAP
ncbi:MAG: hypothetical protein U0269_34925 [Polyangiales bacterium]